MAELSSLHVKITGDSSGAILASSRLVNALAGMDGQVKKVQGSLKTLGPAMDLSTRAMLPQFHRFNREIRTSRFHTANLAAQFNDISVMMLSGQSPFILAVQQGTQVTQVLQAMGGTTKQQFAALGAAFKALISPTSLLTVALIAGGAALVQWGINAYKARDNTNNLKDALKGLEESITSSADELERMNRGLETQEQLLVARGIDEAKRRLEELTKEYEYYLSLVAPGTPPSLSIHAGTIQALEEEIAATKELIARGEERLETDIKTREEVDRAKESMLEFKLTVDKTSMSKLVDEATTLAAKMKLAATSAWEYLGAVGEAERERNENAPRPRQRPIDWVAGMSNEETDRPSRRGGSRTDPFDAEWERLQEQLKSQTELELEAQAERQRILEEALERRLLTQQEYAQMEEEMNRQHQQKMAELDVWRYGTTLAKTGAFLGDMADALAAGNEKMLRISKAFGAAQAFISALEGAANALKYAPFPANLAAYAKVLATGMGAVQAIKGVTAGGGGTAPGVAGAAAAPSGPTNPTYLSFTFTDQFANPESVGRFIIEKMNEAIRNGATIQGLRVS